jgi:hypothetical protein
MAEFKAISFGGSSYATHWNSVTVTSELNLTKKGAQDAIKQSGMLHCGLIVVSKESYPKYNHGEIVGAGATLTFTYPGEANLDLEILQVVSNLESEVAKALRYQELLGYLEGQHED